RINDKCCLCYRNGKIKVRCPPFKFQRRNRHRTSEKNSKVIQFLNEANVNYKTIILRGKPGPEIVKYANEQNADIVIIGSRGLNALQEMVLGSVSHKVMKRVNCPALIIK